MSPAEIYAFITQKVFLNRDLAPNEKLVILTLSYLQVLEKTVPTFELVQERSGIDLQTINMPFIASEFRQIERDAQLYRR
jgi:hypothetical protein